MKILYGKQITSNYKSKFADFEAEIFSTNNPDYQGDTTTDRAALYSLFEKNRNTTVMAIDDEDNIIGFLQTFPLTKQFQNLYVQGKISFKELDGSKVLGEAVKDIDLYIWSIGVKQKYRSKKVVDPNNPNRKVSITQLLHEGLIDSIIAIKKKGITVHKILGEAVSAKGAQVMERFCGKQGLVHSDLKNKFYIYMSDFDPNCEAFSKCKNTQNLLDIYGINKNL